MRIQNTVIVSVYGGVVRDIATDLDPDGVRFILVDYDVDGEKPDQLVVMSGDDAHVDDFTTTPLPGGFSPEDRARLCLDDCATDGQAQSHHEHGTPDCRSPYLWRENDPRGLQAAAQTVVACWENGDLAGAVRQLAACLEEG